MKVGVVMPTYNQAEFLLSALVSYYDQEHPSRLVVVNDGSTDGTVNLLGPEIETIHQTNKGTAEAINAGVSLLLKDPEIEALSWISSDNVMSPDWLSTLVAFMCDRGAGVVYSGFTYVKGKIRLYLYREHQKDLLIHDLNCYYGPAFLIRRDVWEEAGGHRGKISHDYDHWLRVEEVCFKRGLPIVGVNRSLCEYNAHDKRATVVKARQFDAGHWQSEARKRRGIQ